LNHDAAHYDAKCVACHQAANPAGEKSSGAGKNPPVCPVGKKDCASCHMPKIEPLGLHFKLTDHTIRIVRPNDLVPK
jgi:mono/diheme cytochrome c family protein